MSKAIPSKTIKKTGKPAIKAAGKKIPALLPAITAKQFIERLQPL